MSLSASKLSDLPTHLQSRILSFLSPTPISSTKPSLDSVNSLTKPLSKDLLSIANSSAFLRKAVIDVLAARAQQLNSDSATPIYEWIGLLRESVKAVSLYHSKNLDGLTLNEENSVRSPKLLCAVALRTFSALSADYIRLQVLDIHSVPFHLHKRPEELQNALVKVLKTSAPSLRELAVRATPICVKALSQPSLPNLEVVKIALHVMDADFSMISGMDREDVKIKSAESFMQMLCALEGHADRTTNRTTLRELHMLSFEKAPFIYSEEKCKGLLQAIQTLKLRGLAYDGEIDDEVAKFIALFPCLRSLHWDGTGIAQDLHIIHTACPRLEELHLRHVPGYLFPDSRVWPDIGSDTFKDACPAFQGKLRSLALSSALTVEELRILGESSPALENFRMDVNQENIPGLSRLLGTHCRQLKKLNLSLPPRTGSGNENGGYETLGREGWLALAEAIRSASDELCEVSLRNNDYQLPEPRFETMAESVSAILEFLGERAREFHLVAPVLTRDMSVVYDLVCGILNKCAIHTTMLRNLTVRLEAVLFGYPRTAFFNSEDRKKWSSTLVDRMKQLEKLPNLHTIDLEGLEKSARKELESSDG